MLAWLLCRAKAVPLTRGGRTRWRWMMKGCVWRGIPPAGAGCCCGCCCCRCAVRRRRLPANVAASCPGCPPRTVSICCACVRPTRRSGRWNPGLTGIWLRLEGERRVLYASAAELAAHPYDDATLLDREQRLARRLDPARMDVSLRASMHLPYLPDPERAATPRGYSPGRWRSYAFLKALYGADAATVRRGLGVTSLQGRKVRMSGAAVRGAGRRGRPPARGRAAAAGAQALAGLGRRLFVAPHCRRAAPEPAFLRYRHRPEPAAGAVLALGQDGAPSPCNSPTTARSSGPSRPRASSGAANGTNTI